MVLEHKEEIESGFKGTIIDFETIGSFTAGYPDSRNCSRIRPVIMGYIDGHGLEIHCARSRESMGRLGEKIPSILDKLARPLYAFNCAFEMSVFFHSLGMKVLFEGELNREKYEAKRDAVRLLNIPQYGDPFNDNGKLCMDAWLQGEIEKAVAHNRSCLLKERDILLKRGFRKPDRLEFVEG